MSMEKKNRTTVSSLSEFVEWADGLEIGDYIFRGMSDKRYKIEPSTYRRLGKTEKVNLSTLLNVNMGLIEEARLQGHDERKEPEFHDLEMLAELQHYRAATCLIDFTYSALVALWFACQRNSKNSSVSGRVVAVRNNPHRVKEITADLLKKGIDFFFEGDQAHRLYRWQPQQQNNRIIAQQSVFLFGGTDIEIEACCHIPEEHKDTLLASLEKVSGITEAMLFPDFEGFARLHSHRKLYSVPNVYNYLQLASRAHGRDKWKEAIAYYGEAIKLEKKNVKKGKSPDTLLLSHLYLRRGSARFEKERSKSKSDYDKVIKDYDKAIKLDKKNVRAYRYKTHVESYQSG